MYKKSERYYICTKMENLRDLRGGCKLFEEEIHIFAYLLIPFMKNQAVVMFQGQEKDIREPKLMVKKRSLVACTATHGSCP